VTQHVLEVRSHVAVPLQTAGVKTLQSTPVHAPPTQDCLLVQATPLFCHAPAGVQVCGC
jgi:hypothetical protein